MSNIKNYFKYISTHVSLIAVTMFVAMCFNIASVHAAVVFEEPKNYVVGFIESNGEFDVGNFVTSSIVADLNNDGYPDIAGAMPAQSTENNFNNSGVVILTNDGDGDFEVSSYISQIYGEYPMDMDVLDFDQDGDLDLAVANNTDLIRFLYNDGNGSFIEESQLETAPGLEKLIATDFDKDSDSDLIAVLSLGVQIFTNDGSGNFTLSRELETSVISDINVSDFDNDDDNDLLIGISATSTYLVAINENSSFTVYEYNLPGEGEDDVETIDEAVSSDIDGDGDVDLLATVTGSNDIFILTLINNGTGTFSVGQTFDFAGPGSIVAADFDNDGDSDFVVAQIDFNYQTYYFNNDGFGTFNYVQSSSEEIYYLGDPTSLNAADFNDDNKIDLSISSDGQRGIWVILQAGSEVLTPAEQSAALVSAVIALDIPNNIENSYLANLFKVEGFIESNQIVPAINQLNAFINKVNQDYNQNKLTLQERDDLIEAAQQLIIDLSN